MTEVEHKFGLCLALAFSHFSRCLMGGCVFASLRDYVFDPDKAAKAAEAAARKKREEGRRKEYEARMMRKVRAKWGGYGGGVMVGRLFCSSPLVSFFFMPAKLTLSVSSLPSSLPSQAKREGKDPQFYLSKEALAPPTIAALQTVRRHSSGDFVFVFAVNPLLCKCYSVGFRSLSILTHTNTHTLSLSF